MSQDFCRCGNISLAVYLLVILFGVSSWVDINGLWVELPVLVQNLPEGWDLPSYMAITIQIANVAPFAYTIASSIWPHKMMEVPVIYVIISLGALSCLLLAFLWRMTSEIAGTEHSTALLALQFCLALVDCTSSVAFLPFMSVFKPQYMTAYFIGEGFSGLIPSIVALIQGAGDMECVRVPMSQNETSFLNSTLTLQVDSSNSTLPHNISTTQPSDFVSFPRYQEPKFGVQTFFLLLMTLLIGSLVSFILLNYWSYCRREYSSTPPPNSSDDNVMEKYEMLVKQGSDDSATSSEKDTKDIELCCRFNTSSDAVHKGQIRVVETKSRDLDVDATFKSLHALRKTKGMQPSKFVYYLLITAWLNALSNGVLPSLQSYSCLPYGIQAYHLSANMASIANPVACLALVFLKMTSVKMTTLMTALSTGVAAYVIYTAVASPEPPLVGQFAGSFVLIICWSLVVFLMTYTKVSIATEFRMVGKKALLWIGAATQAGSLAGALVTFLLVNVYHLFTVGNPCK
ncbi:unnamed protein product [Lymnaea stagnalis]|uniref:Riboflavin transporter n=1 Tax=Lymnaea stagnalis TaxID=6523 RepID=A0AAV2I213_LYMST